MQAESVELSDPSSEDSSLSECSILIVDDQAHNVDLLKRMLRREGYTNITTCTDPTQTVSLFSQLEPDLILLDLNMPVMDGFDVMDSLKERFHDSEINIIVVTALDGQAVRRNALAAGAKDFINKPIDRTELLSRVRHHIQNRVLQKRLAQQNEVLEQANANLERANQSMSDLVSIVSHELRTPLTSIKSFAEILRDDHDNLASEDRHHFLTIIDNESDRLGRLITDLLDLQKIQSGKMTWKSEHIDLCKTVSDAVEFFGPAYASKDLSLKINATLDYCPVFADDDKLRQVMSNLLSNALKFTDTGGTEVTVQSTSRWARILLVSRDSETNTAVVHAAEVLNTDILTFPDLQQGLEQLDCGGGQIDALIVDIEAATAETLNLLQNIRDQYPSLPITTITALSDAKAHQSHRNSLRKPLNKLPAGNLEMSITNLIGLPPTATMIEVCIKDSGQGIPKNQLNKVFDRFHQVDTSQTRKQQGTGLGLTICQQIVQHYNGKLWVESVAGEGSSFYLLVPAAQEDKKKLGEILIEKGLVTEQQLTDALKDQ